MTMSLPAAPFRCYLVSKDSAGKFQAEITQKTVADLPSGEVLIRVAYSSLNYKDGLSTTGHPGVTRKFPHIPGIDAAGTVVESQSGDFRPGDKVIVTSFDMGQNTWGGFSEYLRVPAAWVVPLPAGMSLRESMIYGAAGGLNRRLVHRGPDASRRRLDQGRDRGNRRDGWRRQLLAVALLAKLGYRVAAVTGKPEAHDYLRQNRRPANYWSRGSQRHGDKADVAPALGRRDRYRGRHDFGHAGSHAALGRLRGRLRIGRRRRPATCQAVYPFSLTRRRSGRHLTQPNAPCRRDVISGSIWRPTGSQVAWTRSPFPQRSKTCPSTFLRNSRPERFAGEC